MANKEILDRWNKTYKDIQYAFDDVYNWMVDNVIDDLDNISVRMEESVMEKVNNFNKFIQEQQNNKGV